MEPLYLEAKARSLANIGGFLVVLVITGSVSSAIFFSPDDFLGFVIMAPIAAFGFFGCCGYIYSFITNPSSHLGVSDGRLWWRTEGWKRSEGMIPMDDVRKVKILEDPSELHLFMRDSTDHVINGQVVYLNASIIQGFLVANYPHLEIEFIEGSS